MADERADEEAVSAEEVAKKLYDLVRRHELIEFALLTAEIFGSMQSQIDALRFGNESALSEAMEATASKRSDLALELRRILSMEAK